MKLWNQVDMSKLPHSVTYQLCCLSLVNIAQDFICKELELGALRHLLQLQHSKCFYTLSYVLCGLI